MLRFWNALSKEGDGAEEEEGEDGADDDEDQSVPCEVRDKPNRTYRLRCLPLHGYDTSHNPWSVHHRTPG